MEFNSAFKGLSFLIVSDMRSNIRAHRQAVIYFAFNVLSYKKHCMNITLLSTDVLCDSSPLCLPYQKQGEGKGKGKGNVHPSTDHEGPEGSRGITLLFL